MEQLQPCFSTGNLQRDAPDSATGRGPLVWEAPFFGVVEGVHMIDEGLMRDCHEGANIA